MDRDYVPDFTACVLPYVQWFQDDFIGGIRGMRAPEIGVYTVLLMEMYARGKALDQSSDRLARMCGSDRRAFGKTLSMLIEEGKIIQLDGGLWNERVETAFRSRAKMQQQQSEAGAASAEKRKEINAPSQRPLDDRSTGEQPISEAQTLIEEPSGSLSETGVSNPSTPKRKRNSYPADFEKAWAAYPTDPNMSKAEAYSAWKQLPPEDKPRVVAGIPGFVAYCRSNPDYRPIHMVGFIKKRRFDGYLATAPQRMATVEEWQKRLDWARLERQWSPSEWGPRPGQPGCLVPAEMLTATDGDGWDEFRGRAA